MFKPLLLAALLFAGNADDDSILPAQPVVVSDAVQAGELLIDFGPGVQALTQGETFSIVLDGHAGTALPLRYLDRMPGGTLPSTVGTSGCMLLYIPALGQFVIVPLVVTGHGSTLSAAVADYKAKFQQAVGNGVPVPCPPANPPTP